MLFTGTYQRSLDGKDRFLLPKKVRQAVVDTELFLTPGTDQCLELHTQRSLDRLAEQAYRTSADSRNFRSFARLFYAQAEQVTIDAQGRIRVPKRLVEWSGLEKEIALVGVGFNWEIWAGDRWQEYFQSNAANFDWVHQTTFDGIHQQPPQEPISAKPK